MIGISEGIVLADRYRLTQRQGERETGASWIAVDLETGSDVWVQFANHGGLTRAAEVVRGLTPPGVPTVLDTGELRMIVDSRALAALHGGEQAHATHVEIVIEFVVLKPLAGRALPAKILRRALPPAEALAIAAMLARALNEALADGGSHGWLGSGSVWLMRRGGCVLDLPLGLAFPDGSPIAVEQQVSGYFAPERLAVSDEPGAGVGSGSRATEPADVFALGWMLYEMLIGHAEKLAEYERLVEGAGAVTTIELLALWRARARAHMIELVGADSALGALVLACLAESPLERPKLADFAARASSAGTQMAGVAPLIAPIVRTRPSAAEAAAEVALAAGAGVAAAVAAEAGVAAAMAAEAGAAAGAAAGASAGSETVQPGGETGEASGAGADTAAAVAAGAAIGLGAGLPADELVGGEFASGEAAAQAASSGVGATGSGAAGAESSAGSGAASAESAAGSAAVGATAAEASSIAAGAVTGASATKAANASAATNQVGAGLGATTALGSVAMAGGEHGKELELERMASRARLALVGGTAATVVALGVGLAIGYGFGHGGSNNQGSSTAVLTAAKANAAAVAAAASSCPTPSPLPAVTVTVTKTVTASPSATAPSSAASAAGSVGSATSSPSSLTSPALPAPSSAAEAITELNQEIQYELGTGQISSTTAQRLTTAVSELKNSLGTASYSSSLANLTTMVRSFAHSGRLPSNAELTLESILGYFYAVSGGGS